MGRMVERFFGPVILVAFALAVVLGFVAEATAPTTVHGAGATFPAPLYARWISRFEAEAELPGSDVSIDYEAVGSGAGIDAIIEGEVAFGASDALLNVDEWAEVDGPLVELPMALGPVVLAYNLPGVDERLILDGPTLAAIYLGDIDRWNHPALVELNPDTDLPALDIRVAHRDGSSGTSAIFTDYLSAVSPTWAEEVGAGKEPDWPTGQSGLGNDGVAQRVLLRPGGLGYVELTYADNAGLDYARLVNRAGAVVEPSVASVQAAEQSTPMVAAASPVERPLPLKGSIVDAPGEASYPIAGFTYLLVYQDLRGLEPDEADGLVAYLTWALTDGQPLAEDLGYTPLPPALAAETLDLIENLGS